MTYKDEPDNRHDCRLPRRAVVKGALGVTALLFVGDAWAQDAAGGPQVGDHLVLNNSTTPLGPDDVDPSATKTIIVRAMDPVTGEVREGNLNKILLVKMLPEEIGEEMTPRAVEGVMAYSAICTHAGCEVKGFKPEDGTLLCQCHGSQFDAKDMGEVLKGPAKHRLASLGLKIENNLLVIADPFDAEVGAQT